MNMISWHEYALCGAFLIALLVAVDQWIRRSESERHLRIARASEAQVRRELVEVRVFSAQFEQAANLARRVLIPSGGCSWNAAMAAQQPPAPSYDQVRDWSGFFDQRDRVRDGSVERNRGRFVSTRVNKDGWA